METTTPGSSRAIEKALFIRATPERVFRALTDPSELEKWFASHAEMDLRPGGALKFTWREGQEAEGAFLIVDPPHRLSLFKVRPEALEQCEQAKGDVKKHEPGTPAPVECPG